MSDSVSANGDHDMGATRRERGSPAQGVGNVGIRTKTRPRMGAPVPSKSPRWQAVQVQSAVVCILHVTVHRLLSPASSGRAVPLAISLSASSR